MSRKNITVSASIFALSYLCLSIAGVCNKLLSGSSSLFTILLFQNGIYFLCVLPQVACHGFKDLHTKRLGLHLFRDVLGVACFLLIFLGLRTVSLTDGLLLFNTMPLWLPLIAWIWLRVKMRGDVWWGILIGFVGVLLILRPGEESLRMGAFFSLAAGLVAACAFVASERLLATEPIHRILFYYSLVGWLATLPFGLAIPSRGDFLLLIVIGICTYLSQFLGGYALKIGKASLLAPVTYSIVVFSSLFDYFIWNYVPDLLTIFGVLLVVAGALLSIYFERKYQNKIAH